LGLGLEKGRDKDEKEEKEKRKKGIQRRAVQYHSYPGECWDLGIESMYVCMLCGKEIERC
jgi:hypothetical protein